MRLIESVKSSGTLVKHLGYSHFDFLEFLSIQLKCSILYSCCFSSVVSDNFSIQNSNQFSYLFYQSKKLFINFLPSADVIVDDSHHDYFDDHHHHFHHPEPLPPPPPPPPPTTPPPPPPLLPEPEEPEEQPRVKKYSYFYLSRSLWYIPLYFTVWFTFYVTWLILQSIGRHKVSFSTKKNKD